MIIRIINDWPWEDTWNMDVEVDSMLDYARQQKQICKDQWNCYMKHGRYILRLSAEQIREKCAELEKSAMYWQEEIDQLRAELHREVMRDRAKWEADERRKREGWPAPLYVAGVQGRLF